MNIVFLVENLDNATGLHLASALGETEHNVDIIPYFHGGLNQCSIVDNAGTPSLVYKDRFYSPAGYDAALLWCWGTAHIGRKYLRLFEDQGITVLNSTYVTEITDSKIGLARILQKKKVPVPETLCFDKGYSTRSIQNIEKKLGRPPYVFKSDYSTRGQGIKFVDSIEDIGNLARDFCDERFHDHGFILQRFIGDPNTPISHYRVLVLGDNVFPFAIKVTALNPMQVSNIAAGCNVELIIMNPELRDISLVAARASGLKIAGIDLMMENEHDNRHIFVIEVNDGPGTKTFDQKGFDASRMVINFFIDMIKEKITYII